MSVCTYVGADMCENIGVRVCVSLGSRSLVASFPGCSHRQYLIASSMKYGGERLGRSRHVRCHQVKTHGGRCPMKKTSCVVLSIQWLDVRGSQGRQSIQFGSSS